MSQRRGEVTRQAIDRDWPHQVEVPATICMGHQYAVVHDFCRGLSLAPRNGRSTRRDDADWLRFAFAKPDDADAFQAWFGGRRLTAAKSNGRWQYTFIPKPAP